MKYAKPRLFAGNGWGGEESGCTDGCYPGRGLKCGSGSTL
jgi:hypothetical protein